MPSPSPPHTSHKSNLPFRILPASTQDIPTLAYIHVEALKDDASAAVKFADKDEFQAKVEDMLRGQIPAGDQGSANSDGPGIGSEEGVESRVGKWIVVKAVLPSGEEGGDDEKIVGWASWLHEDPASIPEEVPTAHPSNNETEHNSAQTQDIRRLMTFPRGLGAHVRHHQTRQYKSWYQQHQHRSPHNEDAKYPGFLSLRACFVLSSFQNIGIGRALVEYGCERADRLMLNTLVTATPAGKGLYERVGGFVVFGDLSVDLERGDWSDVGGQESGEGGLEAREGEYRGEEGEQRWYRFWFLAREYQSRS